MLAGDLTNNSRRPVNGTCVNIRTGRKLDANLRTGRKLDVNLCPERNLDYHLTQSPNLEVTVLPLAGTIFRNTFLDYWKHFI